MSNLKESVICLHLCLNGTMSSFSHIISPSWSQTSDFKLSTEGWNMLSCHVTHRDRNLTNSPSCCLAAWLGQWPETSWWDLWGKKKQSVNPQLHCMSLKSVLTPSHEDKLSGSFQHCQNDKCIITRGKRWRGLAVWIVSLWQCLNWKTWALFGKQELETSMWGEWGWFTRVFCWK